MSVSAEQTTEPEHVPLTPVVSHRYALRPRHLVVAALFGLLFLYLNYLPLWHTDLWSHVSYGEWILDHQSLPAEDPFVPLATGMRVVDSAWLSQVIFASIDRWGGAAWLSNAFALIVFATYVVWARIYYLLSNRWSVMILGLLVVLGVGWSRLSTIRPEIFGVLCFALLCWLLVRSETPADESGGRSRWLLWLGVPVIFVLWANLHGSFLCGLAFLGAYAVGQIIEAAWRTRSMRGVLADPLVRRYVVLTELALLATFINPYGLDLLIYSVSFARNENLRDVQEWTPLVILGVGGREFALSLVGLLIVWRHSRRTIRPYEICLLLVFAAAAIAQIRMLSWYAAVYTLVIVPHLADIFARIRPVHVAQETSHDADAAASSSGWKYTLCGALIVWITFVLSGLSQPILGNEPRAAEKLYGEHTPRGASQYLRENPPSGQLWNPQWWGDWLTYDGPEGLQPYVTTMLHLLPREAWRGYIQVYHAQPGWGELLNRYDVSTVVVDKERQVILAPVMRQDENWVLKYEDDQALVFERAPKPTQNATEEPEATPQARHDASSTQPMLAGVASPAPLPPRDEP